MASDGLTLEAVESRRQREEFLRVPWRVFADDPHWVPPLLLERRRHLDPRHNPWFQHGEARCWIARRGGEAVGRISAQVDRLRLQHHNDQAGNFGFLDAVDDPAVFAALFAAAEGWLREQGMQRVIGPFSLSINDESGLLVEGFERPPCMMMGHARPWYGRHVEAQRS